MPDWSLLIIAATLFVAYSNGANDNFKGVATLFGGGTSDYRTALAWATIATLAGSLAAFFVATELISLFQGNGLVPAQLAGSEPFVASVILAAAVTVMLATLMGMPISTTHGLTGALLGSAFMTAGFDLGFDALALNFFAPLVISPFLAVALASFSSPWFRRGLARVGLDRENCVCVGAAVRSPIRTPEGVVFVQPTPALRVIVDRPAACDRAPTGVFSRINAQRLLDACHFASAGAVSFARGLNDTPKIVALGLAGSSLGLSWSIGSVALVMALGGLVHSQKIAHTLSKRITGMDPEHGLLANLVTSALVILASGWSMPVSTTHVSCGALFGIGVANGRARWEVIRNILLAWIFTLPVAGISAAVIFVVLSRLAVG
jgi:PiT family inorganic phosphate transporter